MPNVIGGDWKDQPPAEFKSKDTTGFEDSLVEGAGERHGPALKTISGQIGLLEPMAGDSKNMCVLH